MTKNHCDVKGCGRVSTTRLAMDTDRWENDPSGGHDSGWFPLTIDLCYVCIVKRYHKLVEEHHFAVEESNHWRKAKLR